MNLKAPDGLLKMLGAERIEPKIWRQPSAKLSSVCSSQIVTRRPSI